jgi:aflatoxin B1 aldehyde reductase
MVRMSKSFSLFDLYCTQISDSYFSGFLVGSSSVEQLENYIKILEKGPLPEAVVKALDDGWLIAKSGPSVYWHGDLKYHYNAEEMLFSKS